MEVLSYEFVQETLNEIVSPRNKALCAILYGTGARINEVLKLRKQNFEEREGHLLISLFTEKNKLHPIRTIPISFKREPWLIEPIQNYLRVCSEQLFSFSDRTVRKITHKYFGCHPHWFRHSRTTHLISIFNAHPEKIRLWMGWKDERPLKVYSHLFWRELKGIFE